MGLISLLISVYQLGLIAYWLLPMLVPTFRQNRAFLVLQRLYEPVLDQLRRLISKWLPARYMMFDWSYTVLLLLLQLLDWIL